MSDKGFTSGERRGLIVLLIIMCCIVGWSIIGKGCSTSRVAHIEITEETKRLHDSIISSQDTSRLERKTKKSGKSGKNNTKTMKPDGKKRDYLAEPIHE